MNAKMLEHEVAFTLLVTCFFGLMMRFLFVKRTVHYIGNIADNRCNFHYIQLKKKNCLLCWRYLKLVYFFIFLLQMFEMLQHSVI